MTKSIQCVVDASVGIKKFILDPLTPKVDQLFVQLSNLDSQFYIPDLFYVECTNVAWKYIRAGLYDATEARENLADLRLLDFIVIPTSHLILDALALSVQYEISAYDACYVALSLQKNVPLLTQDQRLINTLHNDNFNVQLFSDFVLD